MPLDGSPHAAIDLPERSSDAAVRGTRFAYRQELEDEGVQLMLGALSAPQKATAILTVPDIYWLAWVADDALLVSTSEDIRLVRTDGKWSPWPGTQDDPLRVDRDRVTTLRTIDGRTVVAVADVDPDRS